MPAPGEVFKHFRILEPLGKGGMGEVYLAQDLHLDRKVALKFLSDELQRDESSRRRFQYEAKAAAGLDHPFICKIFETGEAEGKAFIAMEYVPGENLQERMRRGVVDAREALRVASEIAEALEEAHAKGIVHRDLKPSNIVVTPQGHVKVMDFGLAKRIFGDDQQQTGSADLTREGFILGSLPYMSPEQARGEKVDTRSDIFSFGVVLHEMISGAHPFRKEKAVDTLSSILRDQPPPLDFEVKGSVPELRRLHEKTLAKAPAERYQSMKEVAQDLRQLSAMTEMWHMSGLTDLGRLGGSGAEEGAARSEQAAPARAGLRSWLIAGGALALGAALVAGIWNYATRKTPSLGGGKSSKPISLLLADFKNQTGDPVFDGTIESALTGTLENASFITAYNRRDARRMGAELRPGTTRLDESLAQLVAVREGIGVVVSGSIAPQGQGYELAIKAVDAMTGKIVVAEQAMAPNKDGVLPAVGRLAARVRNGLGDDTPESLQLAAAETFTASSLHVAHLYAVAQEHAWAGRIDEAIRSNLEAVQIDPNFGRGYAALAVYHLNLKKRAEAEEYYKKAFALLDRMSAREKYRTLGMYYLGVVGNYGQAIETFRKLVELFPSDSAGHNNLGIAYVFNGSIPEAVAASRRALEVNPKSLQSRLNFALYSMYAGDFETAVAEANRILKENLSYQFAYLPLALSKLAQGDFAGARQSYERLAATPAGGSLAAIGRADLEMYLARYREATEILAAGIAADEREKNSGEMAQKYVALAEAHLALGERRKAAEAAEKAAQASRHESILFPAARVLLHVGEDAKAKALAASLETMLQTQTKAYARLITGEIALERNRVSEAVDVLKESQKLRDYWISHFLLGKAYLKAEHFPEALAEMEICRKRLGETTDLCLADTATLHYLPPLYYWLARAQEEVGLAEAARQSYQEFLKLRASASAPDPLALDAAKRTGR